MNGSKRPILVTSPSNNDVQTGNKQQQQQQQQANAEQLTKKSGLIYSNDIITPNSQINTILMASSLNNSNNMNNNNNLNMFSMTMSSMHREIQISKMFAIIFTVFLFGYLPYGIIRMLDKKNSLHPDVYVLLTVLFIISISISPVIYGLMNNQIRIQCIRLLKLLFDCKKPSERPKKNFFSRYNNRSSFYDATGIFQKDQSNEDIINGGDEKREQENKLLNGEERSMRKSGSHSSPEKANYNKTSNSKKNGILKSQKVPQVEPEIKVTPPPVIAEKPKIDLDDGGVYKGPPGWLE